MGLFERAEEISVSQFVKKNKRPLTGVKLCVDDCGKQKSLGEEERMVVPAAAGKCERKYDRDGAAVLNLSGTLVGLGALAVSAASQSVTVGTELVWFSFQLKREAVVYFSRASEQTS